MALETYLSFHKLRHTGQSSDLLRSELIVNHFVLIFEYDARENRKLSLQSLISHNNEIRYFDNIISSKEFYKVSRNGNGYQIVIKMIE